MNVAVIKQALFIALGLSSLVAFVGGIAYVRVPQIIWSFENKFEHIVAPHLTGQSWVSIETRRMADDCNGTHPPKLSDCLDVRKTIEQAALAYTSTSQGCQYQWVTDWAEARGLSRQPAAEVFQFAHANAPFLYRCRAEELTAYLSRIPFSAIAMLSLAWTLIGGLGRRNLFLSVLFPPALAISMGLFDARMLPTAVLTALHATHVWLDLFWYVATAWVFSALAALGMLGWRHLRLNRNEQLESVLRATKDFLARLVLAHYAFTHREVKGAETATEDAVVPATPTPPDPLENLRNALSDELSKALEVEYIDPEKLSNTMTRNK